MASDPTYRKLHKRFWSDVKVQEMLKANRHEEVNFLLYAITGIEACGSTQGSGIYEISRSIFENFLHIGFPRVREIIHYFNTQNPKLLEYDESNHMIFVKNFFKYNGSYKNVSGLMDDYECTFDKAPNFWKEFGIKYRAKLNKDLDKLLPEEQFFLIELFSLKDKPSPNIEDFSANKISSVNNSPSIG